MRSPWVHQVPTWIWLIGVGLTLGALIALN